MPLAAHRSVMSLDEVKGYPDPEPPFLRAHS
jgi:hypothetical protein